MSEHKDSGRQEVRHPTGLLPVERYLAAIVAHEIGNPFTALLGRLELMEIRKGLPDGVRRDLEAMRTAGERIATILENLKTFSRGESSRPRDVPLTPVVERALDRFRAEHPEVVLRVALPPAGRKIHADEELLEEVLFTTLAALVSRADGVRRMELGWGEDPEVEELSLVIDDDGKAYSEEEVARVFHPFSGGVMLEWRDLVILSYGYYIIRAWGGTYRFPRTDASRIELCFVALAGSYA